MRILLTGASGFIGKHVCASFKNIDCELLMPSSKELDLLDSQGTQKYFYQHKPTHMLHLAWFIEPGLFFESAENIRWLQATLSLAKSFAENGGQRFVGTGTCFESLSHPTFYGQCKRHTAELLELYFKKVGVEFAWARLFFLYGPYERPERLVPQVILGLMRDETVGCSSGEQIRDYLYVQDCADMLLSLVESDRQGTFDIASGKPQKLKDLIYAIADLKNKRHLINLGAIPDRPGEPKSILPDNTILWEPKVSLEEGIARTIAYWSK